MLLRTLATFIVLIWGLSQAQAARVHLLQGDHETLQARVDLIQQAQDEILAEYFSIVDDQRSVSDLALLLQAAQRGVKVKIIMDALAHKVPDQMLATLIAKGKDPKTGQQNLEIEVYNSPSIFNLLTITQRDHAKLLVADGKKLITGGRNIGGKYFGLNPIRNFRDVDVLSEGSVAQEARENFLLSWNSPMVKGPGLGKFRPDLLEERSCIFLEDSARYDCLEAIQYARQLMDKQSDRLDSSLSGLPTLLVDERITLNSQTIWLTNPAEEAEVEFLSHDPRTLVSKRTNHMTTRLLEFFSSAKSELNLISPYLVLTKELKNAFQVLLDKGIRVRIITNSTRSADDLLAQAGYVADKNKLIAMGLELYEFSGSDMVHAKVAVIDGLVSIVGSYNLDPGSQQLNREVGLAIKGDQGNQFAQTLSQTIEDIRQNSLLVGQNGKPQNQEKWNEGVSPKKLNTLKFFIRLLPLFRGQL